MSRVIKTIEVEGKPAVALFDTGAFFSYVLRKYLKGVPKRAVANPFEISLGDETFVVREQAIINGKIEGLDFNATVIAKDSLGTANGSKLDAIIGAGTMEPSGISVHPADGSLGLEGLKRREFT